LDTFVAFCLIFYVNYTMMYGCTNIKTDFGFLSKYLWEEK